jgi:hypothetical protein
MILYVRIYSIELVYNFRMAQIDEMWSRFVGGNPATSLPARLHAVQRDALDILLSGQKHLFCVINTGKGWDCDCAGSPTWDDVCRLELNLVSYK